ncbi:MAG: DUF333 domain-containing protein [Moraxella sp.]|nr:DUF333 domain-containing protein [Moraxella sp.]
MKLLFPLIALTALSACSVHFEPQSVQMVGISTPATEFCLKQKGFVNPTSVNGKQVNICELPNGQKVEVNAYYQQNGGL